MTDPTSPEQDPSPPGPEGRDPAPNPGCGHRPPAPKKRGGDTQSVNEPCPSVANPGCGEAQSVNEPCPSVAPKKKRGGRRPGAGAPIGNLNALKHGRRSAQLAQLGAILASLPQTRNALLALARRHRLEERRAEDACPEPVEGSPPSSSLVSSSAPSRYETLD